MWRIWCLREVVCDACDQQPRQLAYRALGGEGLVVAGPVHTNEIEDHFWTSSSRGGVLIDNKTLVSEFAPVVGELGLRGPQHLSM